MRPCFVSRPRPIRVGPRAGNRRSGKNHLLISIRNNVANNGESITFSTLIAFSSHLTLFFLLMQIYKHLLKDSASATVMPVPAEVAEATSEELREPWMDRLDEWTRGKVRPTDSVKDAATAATVRESFFETCGGELQKREIGMRLAQKGFHELPPKPYKDKLKTVSKRVYSFKFDGGMHYVTLAHGEI